MKLLKKGAEGDIFLTSWNKKKAILKAKEKKLSKSLLRSKNKKTKNYQRI